MAANIFVDRRERKHFCQTFCQPLSLFCECQAKSKRMTANNFVDRGESAREYAITSLKQKTKKLHI